MVLFTGEIVYVKVFNLDMIIVNSRRMAYELFDKRSSIYSDRIDFPMLNDVWVDALGNVNKIYLWFIL
ncbi:hypothetical protein M422DRAFT_160023 [Sphaerobolus stellatus SS14]|nr:hypothetical protein M422DRAFT_160023 [Sphaerobolus stellatus SS14]